MGGRVVTPSRSGAVRVITSMDRERELQVVARLRAGDPDAFDVVYDAFHARLYNFLARLSGRREVAEDLLEETWLRLVTHAGRLRPETNLGAWLFTVARRVHVSYCRSRLLEDTHTSELIGLWPSGRRAPTPFEAVEASEVHERAARVFGSLPLAYREALLLIAVEGMRHAEAAEICGISTEAMRQRVSRARALFARRLADTEVPRLVSLKEITT